jgi:glutamate dehydrogenase (NAD(P)+)
VGYWAAKFFHDDGGKVTTIIEYNSAIHNPNGFDIEDVKAYFNKKGTLEGYPKATETNTSNPREFMEK